MSPENTMFAEQPRFSAVVNNIGSLSEEQIELIRLSAQGLSPAGIGRLLGYAYPTIKNRLSYIYKQVGTDIIGTALSLIHGGIIDPMQLTNGFDLSLFNTLNRRQLELIEAISGKSDNPDRGISVIAAGLGCSRSTIKSRLSTIYESLGLDMFPNPRLRVAVLHRAYQQQKKTPET